MAVAHSTSVPGDWIGLEAESVRYRTIAQLLRDLDVTDILDVGCGEGWLYDYLDGIRYLGCEPDGAAYRRALLRLPQGVIFQASAEQIQSRKGWDAIVLNESLYYCERPRKVLRGCARLSRVVIVSILEKPLTWRERLRALIRGTATNEATLRMARRYLRHHAQDIIERRIEAGGRVWHVIAARMR